MGIYFHIARNAGSNHINHSLPRMENDQNSGGNDVYTLFLLPRSGSSSRILSRPVLWLVDDDESSMPCLIIISAEDDIVGLRSEGKNFIGQKKIGMLPRRGLSIRY
mmetsp:Transcript_10774/g.22625  ORF Transcript_10774/g.22625 Transcript_10774/m.22625 type:complete len:106 (-) Transcript_10774:371-688(-)